MQELARWRDRFLAERAARNLSDPTLAHDRAALDRWWAWARARNLRVTDLTPRVLRRYVDRVRRTGARGELSPSSVRTRLGPLRLWFRYLVENDVLLFDPMAGIRIPSAVILCGRGMFREDEVEAILATFAGDDPRSLRERAAVAVHYGAGLRAQEAMDLDLADLDLVARTLTVRQGKGRKDRLVPVAPATCQDLARYLEDGRPHLVRKPLTGAVFLNRSGQRLNPGTVRKRVQEAQRRLGLEPVRGLHALRHSFASHLLRRGAGVEAIRALLGHAQLDTTARYTALDLDDLRQALARHHPRERRSS